MIQEKNTKVFLDNQTYEISVAFRNRGKDLLILFHGLGGSKRNFSALWDFEKLNHVSLLSFDFLGFGQSVKPENFSYKMEDQARICRNILQSYKDFRWHIAAHSMGGAIALLLPDDILDQAVTFANLEGNLIDRDCFFSRKAVGMEFEQFTNDFLPKMKSKMLEDEPLLSDLNQASPHAYYQSCKSLVEWSDSGKLLEKFTALNQKKAYFYGQRNADIEPLRLLKSIEKIQIDQSGHMMMLDNPEDFCEKLKRFLFQDEHQPSF